MKGKIIKSDITSPVSYTITDDRDNVIRVIKNTNQQSPEPYEGICPEGQYLFLVRLEGLDLKKLLERTFEASFLKVDKNGKGELIPIPKEDLYLPV